MSDLAIKVEHLSKEYRLGVIGQDTLHKALSSKWARIRGKEDPNSKLGDRLFDSNERFLALDDVSFEVKKGEVLGVIGGNGAGKSTLLKILSQITSPTKGKISISGRIASLLEVGTGFHPELTGRENVYMNGAILGMKKSEIDRKYDEIVEFAEIEKFIDTPVKRYSSGMYVRLAFAVAAHLEPDILIVDEVLAVGDAKFQKKCLGKIKSIGDSGRTILLVSHNMTTISQMSTKCLYLKEGKLIDFGTTQRVIRQYMSFLSFDSSRREDLSAAERQPCTGKVRFQSVKLCYTNKDGMELSVPEVGCNIKFTIRVRANQDYENGDCAITVFDINGQRMIEAHAMTKGETLELKSGKVKEIVIEIKNCLLRPDKYYISVWAGIVNVENSDWIDNATSITIEPRQKDIDFHDVLPAHYYCDFTFESYEV